MLFPFRDHTFRRRTPWVVFGLIALNVIAFLYQLSLGPLGERLLVQQAGAIPAEIARFTDYGVRNHVPPPFTIFTSMFLHGDILHLLGNMWFLWIYGDNVEDAMGRGRFLLFYLFCGAVAATAQVLMLPDSLVPMIGASGAIAGVLGAYLWLYPRARVDCLLVLIVFFTVVSLPAYLVLGVWFLGQMLSASSKSPGVAWFAHIGGFAAGLLVAMAFMRRRPEDSARWHHEGRWRVGDDPHGRVHRLQPGWAR